MKRKQFLSILGWSLPATILGSETFLSSCVRQEGEGTFFSQSEVQLLNEMAEVIIPETADSPGAKAALVGEFMMGYVPDCLTEQDQNTFKAGLKSIQDWCQKQYKKAFVDLKIEEKGKILLRLDEEASSTSENQEDVADADAVQTGRIIVSHSGDSSRPFYALFHDITLLAYFTSEPGATQALRYIQTPGYYKGEVPYKEGDKAWAL